jgi:hypothetical protein
MTDFATSMRYRPLRAPREDRTALIEPPADELAAMVRENVQLAAQRQYDFQGRPLAQLVHSARRELLCAARRWTSAYRDVPRLPATAGDLIFMAGHQPQLFHPGVWFKNFALDSFARRHDAVAVNLLVDSDTLKSATVRVPCGSPAEPAWASIAIDQASRVLPYEERRILQRGMFADFANRVQRQMGPLVRDPLLPQYWPLAVDRARQTDNLGACLAQSRHQLEGQWGLGTLEVPQSRICQCESFSWFTAHLLAQLPRFRQVYNEALQQYRRVNRIRNAAQPMPDLAQSGPWIESPFWIWTVENPLRRPLFVSREGDRTLLSDRHGLELELPLTPDSDARRAVATIQDLSGRGIKIRSRALITTLWARLVLGDLFLHGIGGAKYDQVSDAIIERFFGFKAPGFMVLSATLHLPMDRPHESPPDMAANLGPSGSASVRRDGTPAEPVAHVRRQLRDLEFHPERFLDPAAAQSGPAAELSAAKRQWIDTPPTPVNARTRYQEFRRINQALQPWIDEARRRSLQQYQDAQRSQRISRVVTWREYAFCLFPEEMLRNFFASLLPSAG